MDRPFDIKHDPAIAEGPKSIATDFSISGHSQNGRQTGLSAILTSLLSANICHGAESAIDIGPSRGTNYSLEDSDAWFDRAISMEDTRRWIEQRIGNDDNIYMLVGMQTLIDPHVFISSIRNRQTEGGIKTPFPSLVEVGAFTGVLASSIARSHQAIDNNRREFVIPGERLYSFEYRQVKYRRLFNRLNEKPRMGDVRYWSCLEGTKRGLEEDDSEDDMEDGSINIYGGNCETLVEVSLATLDDCGTGRYEEEIEAGTLYVKLSPRIGGAS